MNRTRPYLIGLVCLVPRRGTGPRNGPRDAAAAPAVGQCGPERDLPPT
jgi:hypothetical protein